MKTADEIAMDIVDALMSDAPNGRLRYDLVANLVVQIRREQHEATLSAVKERLTQLKFMRPSTFIESIPFEVTQIDEGEIIMNGSELRELVEEKFERQAKPDAIGTLKRVDSELTNFIQSAGADLLDAEWYDIFDDLLKQVRAAV